MEDVSEDCVSREAEQEAAVADREEKTEVLASQMASEYPSARWYRPSTEDILILQWLYVE